MRLGAHGAPLGRREVSILTRPDLSPLLGDVLTFETLQDLVEVAEGEVGYLEVQYHGLLHLQKIAVIVFHEEPPAGLWGTLEGLGIGFRTLYHRMTRRDTVCA